MAVKKLIEVALPLDAINAAAAREKSIRRGHPSTLHLWWARWPLAAARAVIWASLVDDPSSHPDQFPTEKEQDAERERLFRILEDLVVWENSNNKAAAGIPTTTWPTDSTRRQPQSPATSRPCTSSATCTPGGHAVDVDLRTALTLYDKSLDAAKGMVQQSQPAFRIAGLISERQDPRWGIPYDPMGALALYQLAERGLRVDVAHGQAHYRARLQRSVAGQDRMRKVLDDPRFWTG